MGNERALLNLGYFYENQKRNKEAFETYSILKNKGSVDGYFKLACCYQTGIGCETDLKKTFSLLYEVRDQLPPDAQHILGTFYLEGDGIAKNYKEGQRWREIARKNGSSLGMIYEIAKDYYHGARGYEKDLKMAWSICKEGSERVMVNQLICSVTSKWMKKMMRKLSNCLKNLFLKDMRMVLCFIIYAVFYARKEDLKRHILFY